MLTELYIIKWIYRFNAQRDDFIQNVDLDNYVQWQNWQLFNPLNAELNPICHLVALLGAHHIFRVSGLRVKSDCSLNPVSLSRYGGVHWCLKIRIESCGSCFTIQKFCLRWKNLRSLLLCEMVGSQMFTTKMLKFRCAPWGIWSPRHSLLLKRAYWKWHVVTIPVHGHKAECNLREILCKPTLWTKLCGP